MKAKRFIALALALLTASSLFACDSEDNEKDSENTTVNEKKEVTPLEIEEPLVGEGDIVSLLDVGYDLSKYVINISATGLTLWDDGAPENLFDGNDGSSKLGGKELAFPVDITWDTEIPTTLMAYILYTGNDSADWKGRSPVSWVLYGSNDGESWTELDKVDNSTMGDVNATPFGFAVNAPAEFTSYKLSITGTNGVADDGGLELQLNEMVLIGDFSS